jgi:cytochrome c oxidase cbb3-type subunit 2
MRMKLCSLCSVLAAALVAGWVGPTHGLAQNAPVLPNPRLPNADFLQRGKVVYQQHCLGCHGEKGDGNGPGAYGLFPKPRNFTSGIFKFRTTPSGMLPTDDDLVRTVRQGLYGSSMPPFDLMPERDVLSVVQYVKTFSEAWRNADNYLPPLSIPAPPDWFSNPKEWTARAAKGKVVYDASCIACHGPAGNGKGDSAASLVDIWNQPIKPANLAKTQVRSGRNLTDIYKAMVTGVNGTPMPSFIESMAEDQRWEMVAYVDQLRRERKAGKLVVAAPPPPGAPAPAAPATPAPQPAAPAKKNTSEYE